MRIVLARHGKPSFLPSHRVAPRDLGKWIEAYNEAGVLLDDVPLQTMAAARSSGLVVASTLQRSAHSAKCLVEGRTVLVEHVFCEAELPYPGWGFPKLPAAVWLAIFRVAWFFGYAANAESLASATARARAGAERLIQLAEQNDSVFLVGHGIMTALIARQLLARGWIGPARPSHGYWQFSTYTRGVS